MVWLVHVGPWGRFDGSSVTACPNRRLRTKASVAHPTGESTGVTGLSVANGPNPDDANTPHTISRTVEVVDSSVAVETV
jgi:hypothetical protein